MLTVALRSRAQANRWPAGVVIHDVTSRGPEPWVKFSPFYPHGGIPVPFTPGRTAMSVEGIWQALKVFADDDVDESKLDVTTMRGLKRTERRYGRTRRLSPLGWWEFGDGAEVGGDVQAVSVPVLGWAIA